MFFSVWKLQAFTQITSEQLQQYISDIKSADRAELQLFYSAMKYNTAWIQNENRTNRDNLFRMLGASSTKGLQEKDYYYSLVESFRTNTILLSSNADSLEADVQITKAAIRFYHDIIYGNLKPAFRYNGLTYTPDCNNIPSLLVDHISRKLFDLSISNFPPTLPEVNLIESRIKSINAIMRDSKFQEVIIVSKQVTGTNRPLVIKLYQLGIIDSTFNNLSDSTLKEKVKEAQQ